MEDHVDALAVLAERHLLALAGIAERFRRHAGIRHEHFAVGTHMLDAGAIARLELVDQRDVHAADEADLLALADQRRQRTHQERALLLAELERDEVGRHRQRIARAVGGHGVVDVGEADVRVLLRQRVDVVAEDEADADHQVEPLGGQQAQPGLAIGALARLDVAHPRAKVLRRPQAAQVRAVVERLVTATADIEDDADIEAFGVVGFGRARWSDGEQGDVGEEERPDQEKGPTHDPEGSPAGQRDGRGGRAIVDGWRAAIGGPA